jgi:uncharacterized protein YqfB (UPF0267 family)
VIVNSSYVVVFGGSTGPVYKLGINQENPQHPIHVGDTVSNGNGAYLTAGGTWTNGSSREFKEDFEKLNADEVLKKLIEMSICRWRYKGTDEYHIGPVSEDFHSAFRVSEEKYLSSMDVAGVALVAIQELIKQNNAQQEEIEIQKKEIELLKQKIAELSKD